MTMSGADTRRAFVEQGFAAAAAAAALAVPQIALADGAVSEATVQRAKGIYGGRLVALAGAVKSGDFAAVAVRTCCRSSATSQYYAHASPRTPTHLDICAKVLVDVHFAAVTVRTCHCLPSSTSRLEGGPAGTGAANSVI